MKTPFRKFRLRFPLGHRRGFALVIVLSMMILLTLLAVGLLSLSSVSLRASVQGNAMALARSNARLAMLVALGELQKTTGTDRAITAPAAGLDKRYPLGLTGTWTARDPKQETLAKDETDAKFQRWLASSPLYDSVIDPRKPPVATPGNTGVATLLGNGSLGKRKDRMQDDQRIAVQTSRVATSRQSGGFAWAVIDENAKSRVDLYFDEKSKKAWDNVARAGSPPIDGLGILTGWEKFTVSNENNGKLATNATVPMTTLVSKDDSAIYDPDVTVYSNSLMTDPVNGGLKKDLSMLSARALNSTETNARLYKYAGVVTDNVPSDPYLSLLTNYHNLYKRLGVRDGTIRPSPMQVAAKLPSRHTPYTPDPSDPKKITITRAAPTEPLLTPSVVRVDIIFSMITRETHGGWRNRYGTARPYLLHMQYLPIVTLHNPYSVPIVFEGMKVSFKNLPVGFNFRVDDQPLSTRLVALNQMYVSYAGNDSASKDFGINLKPSATSSGGTTLTLEPGQTKIFGTPKVPPTWTWFSESPGSGSDGTHLFDWRNNYTSNFDMGPTMITPPQGGGAGFDIDWINPQPLQTAKGTAVATGNDVGMVSLVGTEKLGVQFGPYMSSASNGSFSVSIDLLRGGSEVRAGGIEVKYGDQARLNEILAKGKSVRFPDTRSFPETYPKPNVDPPIYTNTIYEGGNTPIKDYVKSKQFMIFSLAAKTTQESFIPARTLLTGNPSNNVAIIDLTKNKDPEGGVPLEMVMMPIRNGKAAIEENRGNQEGYFFGGNGSLNGTPRATFYEFPIMPAESLAQFRHANLAGSGFMPFTLYTVGESFAHPQIGTSVSRQTWTDRTVMLDHAYLANRALWDTYFLSTVADQSGPLFSSTKTFSKVLTDFFDEGIDLPNRRFQPYNRGSNKTPESLKQTASGNPAYEELAAYLILNGGFNVNSASVDAWKAVLAALDEAEIETVLGAESASTGRYSLLRVRRPSEKAIDGALIATRQNRWQGYRRLTQGQIDSLAKEIVKEVRARGPFLSLADFVNRGFGPESELTAMGAIQAAIERTDINNSVKVDGKELAGTDVSLNGYKAVTSGIGNNAVYAPGMVSQGDVLSLIGSRITVRGDTFRIRGYGEARDTTGKQVLASAWCEAVVQRVPDYVDTADKATAKFVDLKPVNKRFGRRYEIVAFRWLSPSEV